MEAEPRPLHVEERWILSRLERTIASVTELLESCDFAHAVGEAYSFFRTSSATGTWRRSSRASTTASPRSRDALWALERLLALLHPMMPHVTEEIWSFHPARRAHLAVHPFPEPESSLLDPAAELDVEAGIELTRRLRAWRDLAGVPVASVLAARVEGVEPQEFVARLARFQFSGDGGEAVASVGPVRVLASAELDAGVVAGRLQRRREELRFELDRAERKLADQGFLAKAPAALVEEERSKLVRHRAELEELSE